MTRGKMILLAGATALALVLAAGCSLLPREDTGVGAGWYIKLQVQAAGSKGITVTDFNVTGLNIQVRDPAGEVLQAIDWAVVEGSQTYLVPVKQLGQHQIEVTHFGEREGEAVQATESATFNIQAMKITVIDVVPGCIGMIRISPEPIGGPEDGTITGRVTGAGDHNGYNFQVVVLPAGAELVEDNILGVWEEMIVNGTVAVLVREMPGFIDPLILVGGELYDVYGFLDLDGDEVPSAGDYLSTKTGIEVDGDTLVEFTYPTDFAPVPESPSDWELYGTWTNDDYNGMEGPLAKVVIHESGAVELYVNVWDSTPLQTIQFDITDDWTDEQAHWFHCITDTAEGISYVLLRISDGGNTLESASSNTGYPDPAEFNPSSDFYAILFRQE